MNTPASPPTPPRRGLKLGLLSLGLVAVLLSHVQLQRLDESLLLHVDGRPVDVLGAWDNLRTRALRRCTDVQRVSPDDAAAQAVLAALRGYSEPDSRSARLHRTWRSGDWWLVEARFDALEPAAVLLRTQDERIRVVDTAVWSGPTEPWQPGPLMRQYLLARAPDAPAALLDCFDPDDALFQRRSR